jgi:hypothetical protein
MTSLHRADPDSVSPCMDEARPPFYDELVLLPVQNNQGFHPSSTFMPHDTTPQGEPTAKPQDRTGQDRTEQNRTDRLLCALVHINVYNNSKNEEQVE